MGAPLTARHRRRLAELFEVWEVRNGARAPELNAPAAVYVDTHGGIGIGGSDDHAGVDVGRTWTEAPAAATPREFLAHLRAGRVEAHGAQGSAAKWAHAAMAIAVRTFGRSGGAPPDPAAVLRMVERVMAEGDTRAGAIGADLGPEDARALLRAWLAAIDLDLPDGELLALLQADGFSHSGLYRRARRCHERKLQAAVGRVLVTAGEGGDGDWAPRPPRCSRPASRRCPTRPRPPSSAASAASSPATTGACRGWRSSPTASAPPTADAHARGAARAGVPGFEVEVIGTDGHVDRRLSSVCEVGLPFAATSRSAFRACPRSSTPSPRGATTCCTCAPPARPGSPRR